MALQADPIFEISKYSSLKPLHNYMRCGILSIVNKLLQTNKEKTKHGYQSKKLHQQEGY